MLDLDHTLLHAVRVDDVEGKIATAGTMCDGAAVRQFFWVYS